MSLRLLILTLVLSIFAFAPAQAKENCKNPQTQVDMNICAGNAYKKADEDLNKTYQKALEKLQASNVSTKGFKNVQKSWIKFRDLNCKYAADAYEGGTMAPLAHLNCMTELTEQRTKQIPGLFAEWE